MEDDHYDNKTKLVEPAHPPERQIKIDGPQRAIYFFVFRIDLVVGG